MLTVSELNSFVGDEIATVRFMQKHDLLPADDETWPCKRCNGQTNIYARRKRTGSPAAIQQIPTVRCAHRGCQTYHSIRTYNTFFASVGSDRRCSSNLGLGAILKLVYHWCWGHAAERARADTGRSPDTVVHWYDACRDVCVRRFDERAAMGGPGSSVRVDVFPLHDAGTAGRRRLPRRGGGDDDDDDDGPWIVCASWDRGAADERRYFVVGRRDFAAVRPIVRRDILAGTTVTTDAPEHRAGLRSLGYDCQPTDGPPAGTACPGLNVKTLRKTHRAADAKPLRRCLAEAWYRSTVGKHDDAFVGFFRHINAVHRRR